MAEAAGRTLLSYREAQRCGMGIAVIARGNPGFPAIRSEAGDLSYDELNARANQLARALRARGLGSGDAVALVCSNRPEFAVVFAAALRAGLRLTPINWHLTGREIAYILENCEAKVLLGDARFAAALGQAAARVPALEGRLALGGHVDGFDCFEKALAEQSAADLADPVLGRTMLYTSGTTGNPKGVYRHGTAVARGAIEIGKLAGYVAGEDVNLCTGPLYHAAPLAFSLAGPLSRGVCIVMMDRWGPVQTLELIARHRVTHTHMVPTMFHRLLNLPAEERRAHDLSSLRMVLHGAAPCPVPLKSELMSWLGPIVYEYYAATEGWGCYATPDVWLSRPGTVGKPDRDQVRIRGDGGEDLSPNQVGQIYLRAPTEGRFEYYKDRAKTARAFDADRAYFTLGDVGYLDEDGFLFLVDRSADVINSAGVNIYPAEVDAVLLRHPAVGDAATVGIPDEDRGEEVCSVVELRPGWSASDALAGELIDFCRASLAHYKCPRGIDFTDALPRHDTGKIYRRLVREKYWRGRGRRI